jgi:hypothetical protein
MERRAAPSGEDTSNEISLIELIILCHRTARSGRPARAMERLTGTHTHLEQTEFDEPGDLA